MRLGKEATVGSPMCDGTDNLYQASYRVYPGEYKQTFRDNGECSMTIRYAGDLPDGEVRTDSVTIRAKGGLIGVYDRSTYNDKDKDMTFTYGVKHEFVDTKISYIKDGKVFQITFIFQNGDSGL